MALLQSFALLRQAAQTARITSQARSLHVRTALCAPNGFRVVRQDDHGRRYIVEVCESRDDAEERISELEKRSLSPVGEGHKQTYFVEELAVRTIEDADPTDEEPLL
eukprot:m.303198 g.303198  ORF g.303198 m.303198 type:complete len:107 (-) comp15747_c0_seq1:191-511(-)